MHCFQEFVIASKCYTVMVIDQSLFLLVAVFFGISFIYSSVGFGGGSSYIAALVLVGISVYTIPTVALPLNIIVASISMYHYVKAKQFSFRFSLPFTSSIPSSFIASLITLSVKSTIIIFVIALFSSSIALLISGIRKFQGPNLGLNLNNTKLTIVGIPIGIILGSIAGFVGIGGGIWLSPLLILSGLANPKMAAATASFFIITNSISGFIAHSISKPIDFPFLLPLVGTVIIGGFLGSRLGAFKFNQDKIRIIVGIVVAIAGTDLLFSRLLNY